MVEETSPWIYACSECYADMILTSTVENPATNVRDIVRDFCKEMAPGTAYDAEISGEKTYLNHGSNGAECKFCASHDMVFRVALTAPSTD